MGSIPLWSVSIPEVMTSRSTNLGVIEGTPNDRQVPTQLEENAEVNMRIGTNHKVASAPIRTPRSIPFPFDQAFIVFLASSVFLLFEHFLRWRPYPSSTAICQIGSSGSLVLIQMFSNPYAKADVGAVPLVSRVSFLRALT